MRASSRFDDTGLAANKGSRTPKICGGTFEFAGMEADLAEGGAFTGVIHEHDSIDGNSVGNLTEGWGGGEAVAAGEARLLALVTRVYSKASWDL
jgi:hypothetical protein